MLKVYQVPMLFARNSDEHVSPEEGCFMVLIFEKSTRKRTYAKTTSQFQKLKRSSDLKKMGETRYVEELLMQRDSKMRRFSNYFVTLFNQKKINPFTQFIPQPKLKVVKQKVREKMDQFTTGEKGDAGNTETPDLPGGGNRSSTEMKEKMTLDEYADIVGNKAAKQVASKTPVPQMSATNSAGDLRKVQSIADNLSKVSLNFGSRTNISSICHIEEISEGRASIDR